MSVMEEDDRKHFYTKTEEDGQPIKTVSRGQYGLRLAVKNEGKQDSMP